MHINCLLEAVPNIVESIFDVSREKLIAPIFWIIHVKSRQYIPVDGIFVTIT